MNQLYFTLNELIKQRLAACGPEADLEFNATAGYIGTSDGYIWYAFYSLTSN